MGGPAEAVGGVRPITGELMPFSTGGSSESTGAASTAASQQQPQQQQQQAAGSVDNAGESTQIVVRSRPVAPSPAEVEAHEVLHYPYRDWCRYCVAAQGRRDCHARVSKAERDSGVATVASDYCYFNDMENLVKSKDVSAESSHTPILISKCRSTGALFADCVLSKGACDHAILRTVDHLSWLGHSRMKYRSDGEPAIRTLVDNVSVKMREKGVDMVQDRTPAGDSAAGGLQESAVKQFKDKCRTLWHQAVELHFGVGGQPQANQSILPWCVQYAAQLATLTVKGDDGKTAWSHITGRREFPRPLLPWGEKVWYIAGGGKFKAGVEPKWEEGIFLALIDQSSEYVIGTPGGCVRSSSIKRMPKEHARDPELFNAIKHPPWRMTTREIIGPQLADIPTRIEVASKAAEADTLPQAVGRAAEVGPRKIYIRPTWSLQFTATPIIAQGVQRRLAAGRRSDTALNAGRGSKQLWRRIREDRRDLRASGR